MYILYTLYQMAYLHYISCLQMRLLCHYHNVLVCANSLLDKVLKHFEIEMDGWVRYVMFMFMFVAATSIKRPPVLCTTVMHRNARAKFH